MAQESSSIGLGQESSSIGLGQESSSIGLGILMLMFDVASTGYMCSSPHEILSTWNPMRRTSLSENDDNALTTVSKSRFDVE